MNNIEEILEAIRIAIAVATFLLHTGRAHRAIELSKESLVFLNSEGLLSIKQDLGKLIYGGIYNIVFEAYILIHDYTSAITYGSKLLVIYCECGETVLEGWLSIQLAEMYQNQNKYMLRQKNFMREQSLS